MRNRKYTFDDFSSMNFFYKLIKITLLLFPVLFSRKEKYSRAMRRKRKSFIPKAVKIQFLNERKRRSSSSAALLAVFFLLFIIRSGVAYFGESSEEKETFPIEDNDLSLVPKVFGGDDRGSGDKVKMMRVAFFYFFYPF